MIRSALQRSLAGLNRMAVRHPNALLSRSVLTNAAVSVKNSGSSLQTLKSSFTSTQKRFTTAAATATDSTGAATATTVAAAAKASTKYAAVTKPAVAYWLYFNAGMVFSIVVVGGLTRLTESGLSITEWNVISGMKPPRSELEWTEEFEKYKQFPEYKL